MSIPRFLEIFGKVFVGKFFVTWTKLFPIEGKLLINSAEPQDS